MEVVRYTNSGFTRGSQVYYSDGEPSKGLVTARLALKLFFFFLRGRGRDRNLTSYYQSLINKLPLTVKNIPDTFSIDFACLQTSPFETVIINTVTRKTIFFHIKSADMHS